MACSATTEKVTIGGRRAIVFPCGALTTPWRPRRSATFGTLNEHVCSFASNSRCALCDRCHGELACIRCPVYSHAQRYHTLCSRLGNFRSEEHTSELQS